MNRKIEMKPFYRQITQQPALHARLLNTFSYLEYIGFRKILKSQLAQDMTLSVLAHASEESRHALILKKMALRIGSVPVDSYAAASLLCGTEAENYFQTLDQTIFSQMKAKFEEATAARLTYLYVTWLIEIRALSVYADYIEVLAELKQSSPLESLMAEEDRHLEFVSEFLNRIDPDFLARSVQFKNIEYGLFTDFFARLEQSAVATDGPTPVSPLVAVPKHPGLYDDAKA